MPRSASVRTKEKTYTTDENNHGQSSVTMISAPRNLEDEIRTRAYLLYEQEGRQGGHDQEYWLRAESEVLRQYGARRG
jgi:Protein of unknown function (DUF2934)